MPTPSQAASAHGAQMAKYFTLNQPPHVAIDSAVSVVRPQLAITRLIARSGIPERTASIPPEKAYVVSVHLNHANSGEWELWTDEKYTKTGAWPVGGVAMCDLESNSSIRNPGPIDWVHFHVPRATLNALTDDAGMRQVKRLHCVYGTPDPVLHHLTQAILPCLNRPEMFGHGMLGVRRDHLVFGSDKVPAWLCPPRRLGDRTTESFDSPRDLRVGHKRSHIWTHIRGEEGREFGFIEEQVSILRRQDRRGRRTLRCILDKR